MQVNLNREQAKGLNRLVHDHLTFVDIMTGFFNRCRNISCGNRTKKLAHFRCGTNQNHRQAVHIFHGAFCSTACFLVAAFTFCTLSFKFFQIGFVCSQRFASWQQIVTRIAGLHIYHIAELAQLVYTFKKNNFHVQYPFPVPS